MKENKKKALIIIWTIIFSIISVLSIVIPIYLFFMIWHVMSMTG